MMRHGGGDQGEDADGEEAEHPGEGGRWFYRAGMWSTHFNVVGERYSQDWLPASHAHDEGADDVGRDLYHCHDDRVQVNTTGHVDLMDAKDGAIVHKVDHIPEEKEGQSYRSEIVVEKTLILICISSMGNGWISKY